jgi:hypothetical protein
VIVPNAKKNPSTSTGLCLMVGTVSGINSIRLEKIRMHAMLVVTVAPMATGLK